MVKELPNTLLTDQILEFFARFSGGFERDELDLDESVIVCMQTGRFFGLPDAAERNYFPLAKKYRNLTSMCFFISNISKSMGNKVGHYIDDFGTCTAQKHY